MKDFYADYKAGDLWCVKEEGFYEDIQNIRESQFTIGNGFIGSRGVLEENPQGAKPGTYVAGIYDRLTSQVAELVNLPNPFYFKFTLKGEKVGLITMDVLEHERILNMRDGVLLRRTVYSDVKKRKYDYQSLRFLSMADKNIGVIQIVLTPLDADAEVELQAAVDVSVQNSGTLTEENKRHFHTVEVRQEDHSRFRLFETLEKHQKIIYRDGLYYQSGGKKTYAPETVLSMKLKKGKSVVFTKVFYIKSYQAELKSLTKDVRLSRQSFNKAYKGSVKTLLKNHIEEWHKLWKYSDVLIDGTADIQKNLRFNIYHMLICAHVDNGYSSIGARTMSGEGYRGHIFWDAEIFLLPFYLYTQPEVAKNMLLYRYHRLDQARQIAKTQGYEGAMFPWESAGTGEEETPTWAKNLDGTIIRIKTNELEHHITADIAFACAQYGEVAGDQPFMKKYGYELLLDTAKFWASRVQKNRKGSFEIRNVIGPDEFHEHVDNNAYTNMMAKWNLLAGYRIYFDLKKKQPQTFKVLKSKLGLTDKAIQQWKFIASRIVFKMRKDRVIEQFDGYLKRRLIQIKDFDENGIPLLPKGVKVKDYNTTQFVKQADVLMLLYLFSDVFQYETKEKNFWFYVDRTLHKSSLSPAIHAIMGLEVGALHRAYQFFNVALRADISNLHGNTHEGIHAASLGGVWQMVIHGFAGLKKVKEVLSIDPFLPKTWRRICFCINWKGTRLLIEAKNNEVKVKSLGGGSSKVKVCVFGVNHLLVAKKQYIFHRKKKRRQEVYY